MDYLDKILTRANLFQLCSFLIDGTYFGSAPSDCKQWLHDAQSRMDSQLKKAFPDWKAYEEISSLISEFVVATQFYYMELGMKAGTRLILELFDSP